MSAVSLASLGVICEDRALSMASLGVFCGQAVAPTKPIRGTEQGEAPGYSHPIVNVIARYKDIAPLELKVVSRFEAQGDAITEQVLGGFAFIGVDFGDAAQADARALFTTEAIEHESHHDWLARAAAHAPMISTDELRAEGGAIIVPEADGVTEQIVGEIMSVETTPFEAVGIKNLTDEELLVLVKRLRGRRRH